MDVVAKLSTSAPCRPVVVAAWHRPVVLGVDELRSHPLKHGLPLFVLELLLIDEPFQQLNSLLMVEIGLLSNNSHDLRSLTYISKKRLESPG